MVEGNTDKILQVTEGFKHLVDVDSEKYIYMYYVSGDSIRLVKTTKLLELVEVKTTSFDEMKEGRLVQALINKGSVVGCS